MTTANASSRHKAQEVLMATRSFIQLSFVTLALAFGLIGCAQNQCSGSACTCNSAECVSSCPQGGCDVTCNGTRCELDCAGNNCNLSCSPGATSCVIRSCTSGCNLTCNGASTCSSSCDLLSGGCATTN